MAEMRRDFREKALREAREDEESTKARILRVAEDLFAKKGFKGTTTRDISEAADVNIAMIHYHWGSKEELWNAVNTDLFERGLEFMQDLASKFPKIESKEDLARLTFFLFDYLADNPNIPLMGYGQEIEGVDKSMDRNMVKLFFKSMEDYMKDNMGLEFEPADFSLAIFCCLGAYTIFFYRPDLVELYFEEDPKNLSKDFREKVTDTIVTMVERFGRMD